MKVAFSFTVSFTVCFFILTNLSFASHSKINLVPISLRDSIGVEIVNEKEVVLHRLKPKETYYGISRQYGIAVNDLINFNNNKALKIGEIIRVPTNRSAARATSSMTSASNNPATNQATTNQAAVAQQNTPEVPHVELNPGEYTSYKVSKGETLYTVSKRFNIPVNSIKLANGLSSDAIKEGQILMVPKKEIAENIEQAIVEEPVISATAVIDSTSINATSTTFELPKNRYGIREMNEKGLGVWIDDLSQDGGTMLALHKTAPVGTIVKVTNPMTNLSTFVKVVGKFIDTAETQGAILIISKSVAGIIGILDRRFQIEITYGAPVEEEPR
jgi:LysM repeat protein